MHEALETAVYCLRLGMNGAGCNALTLFIDKLTEHLAQGNCSDQALLPDLKRILEAQKRLDYLYVADVLEYRISPKL